MLAAPIVGAHVRISVFGAQTEEVAADTVTDQDGNFDVELTNGDGTILVEVLGDQGGTTVEPISQKPLQLSYTDRFANMSANVSLGQHVAGLVISPWSTMLTARAQWDMKTNSTSASAALVSAATLFVSHFDGIAFMNSSPLDPASGPTNGLSSGAVHGFVTCGLAAMGNDLSRRLSLSPGDLINTISLTQWLADELITTGHFGGAGANGPITIIDSATVDVEFTRADLGAALGTFVTSSQNQSGVKLADLTALINAITSDSSNLYASASSVATSNGDGPTIVVTAPITDSTLRDQVLVTGDVTSPAGVSGIEIYLDDTQVANGNRTAVGDIEISGAYPLTDGFHVLKVVAHDSGGKASSLTVPFSSDATPPSIAFSSCTASDDRSRTAVPVFSAQTGSIKWWAPGPADAGCTAAALDPTAAAPYIFHTYSELAKAAATASQLSFSPQDAGPVTTPQSALIFEASISKGGAQIGSTTRIVATAGQTTRNFALSTDFFGDALRDVSINDVLQLHLVATDAEGNQGTLVLQFVMDFLPSPMRIDFVTLPTGSSERVESYSFANGNLNEMLDPASALPVGLFVVERYAVTNVSDRATNFSIPLQAGSALNATYAEWVGFVAGEAIDNGADALMTTADTESGLATLSVQPHWNSCYDNVSAEQFSEANITYPLQVTAVSGGNASCVDSNGLLTATPVETTTANWAVRVTDSSGGLRFPTASGDFLIQPGEELNISIGFDKPSFAARQPLACALGYNNWAYTSPFAPQQNTDLLTASGSPTLMSLPLGLPFASTTLMQYRPLDSGWTYSDLGWVDCIGVSCGQQGCRTQNDQFIMRLEAAQFTTDHQAMINDGGTAVWGWVRQAYREWSEFALSRLNQPYQLSVSGHARISTASHLVTNSKAYDFTFDLPQEQPSVSYSTTFARNRPAQTATVIYTKGTLP